MFPDLRLGGKAHGEVASGTFEAPVHVIGKDLLGFVLVGSVKVLLDALVRVELFQADLASEGLACGGEQRRDQLLQGKIQMKQWRHLS